MNMIRIHRVRGLTLIEVMIAMVIGLIILGAMSSVMINNTKTSREIDKVGKQIEETRFALQTLVDDISNAGFYAGEDDPSDLSEVAGDFCSSLLDPDVPHDELPHDELLEVSAGAVVCMGVEPLIRSKADLGAGVIKDNTESLMVRRLGRVRHAAGVPPVCPDGMVCLQAAVDSDGGIDWKKISEGIQGDNKTFDDKDFMPLYYPVMNVYYVEPIEDELGFETGRLRRITFKWSGGEAKARDDVIAEGVEVLNFDDGEPGLITIDIVTRASLPTEKSKDVPDPGLEIKERFGIEDKDKGGKALSDSRYFRRIHQTMTATIYNAL